MQKLTITFIGQPKDVTTKFGPKQKNSIKTIEHGDKYLSYWVSPATSGWAVGQTVEVDQVTSREWQGKTYWDIVMPKKDAPNAKQHEEVMKYLVPLSILVKELVMWKRDQTGENKNKVPGTDIDYPEMNETNTPSFDSSIRKVEDNELPF